MTRSRRDVTRRARLRTGPQQRQNPSIRYLIGAVALLLAAAVAWLVLQQARPPGAPVAVGSFQHIGTVEAADYHSLTFSPTDANLLWFGHHNGVMQSSDGGRTWSPAVSRADFDAMILTVSPANPTVLWMAGHNVFHQSRDGGATWSEMPPTLPGLDLHGFAVGAVDPALFYAFAVGHGLFRTADAGETWEPLASGAPRAALALAVGGASDTLYVGTQQGIVVSRDGGKSFGAPIHLGGPVTALAAAADTSILYAATPQGLYRSTDGGQAWTKMNYGGSVAALAVAPSDAERVVLVDHKGRVFARS